MKLAVLALSLVACVDEHALQDTGKTCAFAPPVSTSSPQRFEVGKPLVLRTTLDSCLYACSTNLATSCRITRSDSTLYVTAKGSWSEKHSPDSGCAAVCLGLEADCQTEPLAAGTYTLAYAGMATTITVPSMVPEEPCAGVEN